MKRRDLLKLAGTAPIALTLAPALAKAAVPTLPIAGWGPPQQQDSAGLRSGPHVSYGTLKEMSNEEYARLRLKLINEEVEKHQRTLGILPDDFDGDQA